MSPIFHSLAVAGNYFGTVNKYLRDRRTSHANEGRPNRPS